MALLEEVAAEVEWWEWEQQLQHVQQEQLQVEEEEEVELLLLEQELLQLGLLLVWPRLVQAGS